MQISSWTIHLCLNLAMSDPATSRCDKNYYFFSVNRQAVAGWRPMPSNLNSNYTKLGTLSYN